MNLFSFFQIQMGNFHILSSRSLMHSVSPQCTSVQLLSHVWRFANPQTTAHQASLSISNSQILPKLMSIESMMPSNHLILCCPLLLLPSIFPSIRVFSNESVLHIRWPKYWSFSFNNQSFRWTLRTDLLQDGLIGSLCSPRDSKVFSNTKVQKHQFFGAQISLQSNSHIYTWLLERPWPWLDRPLIAK